MQHEHREMLIEPRGSPPQLDWFKFNVDGEGRGKPSLVGIGGVLRNIYEEVLITFSGSLCAKESNEVKPLDIGQALRILRKISM